MRDRLIRLWWDIVARSERLTALLEEYRDRNECGWDLVAAVPARRSITPRTVSRQLDKDKRRRK